MSFFKDHGAFEPCESCSIEFPLRSLSRTEALVTKLATVRCDVFGSEQSMWRDIAECNRFVDEVAQRGPRIRVSHCRMLPSGRYNQAASMIEALACPIRVTLIFSTILLSVGCGLPLTMFSGHSGSGVS